MNRVLRLLPAVLLTGCATQPPAPPPPAEYVTPESMKAASDWFGYSQAVRVGPWITVSAVPGFDTEKLGFPEDFAGQAEVAFANLKAILEAAGAGMDDVIELTTYQLDMARFNQTVDARNEAFGNHRPAWTALGVSSLPLPSMQFQVAARAYVPLARPPGAPLPAAPAPAPAPDKPPQRYMHRPGY